MANTKNFIAKNGYSTGDGYDMPDVRPSLLLDFANSKTLDPRITFTRGSTATYWDGKTTHKAEENLTQYSNNFANAYWTKEQVTVTEGATAPDGSATAATVQATINGDPTQAVYHLMDPVPQIGASVSIYAKEGTTEFFALQAGTSNPNALFNLNTGAVLASTGCTATITSVGNGWYRCALENITTTAGNYIMMSPVGSDIGTGDAWGNNDAQAGDNVLIWGVQLENNSSPTAYTATGGSPIVKYQPTLQTAASGEVRFDHDPVTGESKGLLIEETRTNLVDNSVPTAAADNNGISFEASAAVAPDGTITAGLMTSDSTNDGHYAYFEDFLRTSGNKITVSIFVKPLSMSRGYIWLGSGSSALPNNIVVDTSDWTVTDSNGTASSVTEVGNGWYRISTTGTATATGTAQIYCGFIAASTYALTNYVGDPSDRMLLWGFQAETGSFPAAYIPTSGSTVTKSRDLAYINDLRSQNLLNPEDGTFYLEFQTGDSDNTLSDSSFAGGIGINSSNYLGVLYATAGTAYLQPTHGQVGANYPSSPPSNGKWKTALRWTTTSNGETEAQGFLNGGHGDSDTQGGITVFKNATDPDLTIGWVDFSTNSKWGWIRKVALWPSDLGIATLDALTEE